MTTAAQQPSAPESTLAVLVEPDGPGRFLARAEGMEPLALSVTEGDQKPRARDVDLARWLGFAQPRMIRKLIKRMESEGKLREIDWRSTVERQSTGNGASREYTVREAFLTREQALLVATQSDTPRAWALVETMARVFDRVLDALSEERLNGPAIAQMIRAALAEHGRQMREEIARDLRAELSAQSASAIGTRDARKLVLDPVKVLAARLAKTDPAFSYARHVGLLHYALRDAARWWRRWADLPRERLAVVLADLGARERSADRREELLNVARRTAEQARQVPLPFEHKNDPTKPS